MRYTLLALLLLASAAQAATMTWNGSTSVAWNNANNWSPSGIPGASDFVVIDGTYAPNAPTLQSSDSDRSIAGLSIGGGALSAVLTLQRTLTVTTDATVGALGTIQFTADIATGALNVNSNLTVNGTIQCQRSSTTGNGAGRTISVGGNLIVGTSGVLDAGCAGTYKAGRNMGFTYNAGPGTPTGGNSGASYGGYPGGSAQPTYGSVTSPSALGSGGANNSMAGGEGGGAIRLIVTHNTVLNGTISATGGNGAVPGGHGAGGSIWLTTKALSGVGSMDASAGAGGYGSGGGRIAVILTGAGADFSGFSGAMTAYGAGAGTVYRELPTDAAGQGELIVNNGGGLTDLNGGQALSYTFSRVTVTNAGVIAVSANGTLNLSGATIKPDPSAGTEGLRLTGGTLVMPAVCVVSNYFISIDAAGSTFNPATSVTIATNSMLYVNYPFTNTSTGGLTIQAGGLLSHAANGTTAQGEMYKIDLTVASLTVDAGGAVYVKGLGYLPGNGPGTSAGSSAGGSHGGLGAGGGPTYGAITNPVTIGSGGANNSGFGSAGGGAIKLTVNGAVTLNGSMSADGGIATGAGSGAGGSVWLTATELSGSAGASITANSGAGGAGGGGGHVAVILTQAGAGFSGYLGTITAYGGGGAGTVYRKTGDPSYGDLIVDNNGVAGTTLINTQMTDTDVRNVYIKNNGYLQLAMNRTLTVYGSWSNAVAPNAISGGTVVLAGAAPATVWGGNTWSNLVITNAGKVVYFETNKVQTITGTPTFDNYVTLRSSVDGVRWIISKTSAGGTQYVGKVSAKDSNATNDVFKTTGGSDLFHNYHWLFPASGTVVIMR